MFGSSAWLSWLILWFTLSLLFSRERTRCCYDTLTSSHAHIWCDWENDVGIFWLILWPVLGVFFLNNLFVCLFICLYLHLDFICNASVPYIGWWKAIIHQPEIWGEVITGLDDVPWPLTQGKVGPFQLLIIPVIALYYSAMLEVVNHLFPHCHAGHTGVLQIVVWNYIYIIYYLVHWNVLKSQLI